MRGPLPCRPNRPGSWPPDPHQVGSRTPSGAHQTGGAQHYHHPGSPAAVAASSGCRQRTHGVQHHGHDAVGVGVGLDPGITPVSSALAWLDRAGREHAGHAPSPGSARGGWRLSSGRPGGRDCDGALWRQGPIGTRPPDRRQHAPSQASGRQISPKAFWPVGTPGVSPACASGGLVRTRSSSRPGH
jgi:hypothetical protein